MPVWHDSTRDAVKAGKLVLLGVTQEQHADRCRLFAQWKQLDWPILHDPINVLESAAVPIIVAIDEHGIVRSLNPRPDTFAADFLDRTFPDDADPAPTSARPDLDTLRANTQTNPSPDTHRALGDALALWTTDADAAIAAYRNALNLDPDDARVWFRVGVALRARHENPEARHPDDFQATVNNWTHALNIDPNQYIWRRRLEQYGPRLAKPYPFYDWIDEARADINARGETPHPLPVEPYGSELAGPIRTLSADAVQPSNPDPDARINRDTAGFIEAEVAVVPPQARPGQAVRVHVTFRPNRLLQSHWNNESTPLRLWIDPPEGWTLATPLLEADQPTNPESDEPRRLDFELLAPTDAPPGPVTIDAYALYNTCEQAGGQCLLLRRDLTISYEVTHP